MIEFKNLKEQVFECNKKLPELGLVLYTFGNVSGIDRKKNVIAIKPSGVSYEDLKVDDITILDLENNIIEGKMRPSSDTKTHILLYNHFPEIHGIVHTHSTYASAWAQAIKPIPILGTTHADHLTHDIPCTEVMSDDAIKGNYELETGNQILDVFKDSDYKEIEMVLVAGHGPFTWGKTPEKAVYNSAVLEELAKMACLTMQINPGIQPIKQTLRDKHYQRKHGDNSYYGQKNQDIKEK